MNANQALNKVIKEIFHLIERGISITIDPHRTKIDETWAWDKSKSILPKKWMHIHFNIDNSTDLREINLVEKKLFDLGIYFDTGFGGSIRDWELDWSFQYKPINE